MTIICPYCFEKMRDDEVLFRSERVESAEMPEDLQEHFADYEDLEDFNMRYKQPDKDAWRARYEEWDFFRQQMDPAYEKFWREHAGLRGTTEGSLSDRRFGVNAYMRKVLDPSSEEHQKRLRKQADGNWIYRDTDGMAAGVQLSTGENCERRVCRYCRNPLPDNYGKHQVRFISVIGITASGKTVWLSQLLKRMRAYMSNVGLAIPFKSDSVATFLENNPVIPGMRLPGSTPEQVMQQPLFFELAKSVSETKMEPYTMVLYDVSGEEMRDAKRVKKWAPFIQHSDGILLLIDSHQIANLKQLQDDGGVSAWADTTWQSGSDGTIASLGRTAENAAKARYARRDLDEPSEIMNAVYGQIKQSDTSKCSKPVAVCISKMDDLFEHNQFSQELSDLLRRPMIALVDNRGFPAPVFNAQDYNPIFRNLFHFFQYYEKDLWNTMNVCFSSYAYFAFSALGCSALKGGTENSGEQKIFLAPRNIQPMRIEEPLLWILHKLDFIGTWPEIRYPYEKPKPVLCPICELPLELIPEMEREERRGFLGRKIDYFKWRCAGGHKWRPGEVPEPEDGGV